MENTSIRSTPCPECGAEMVWTQNAWNADNTSAVAAYRCLRGHVLDPSTTRQCPGCGLHDTALVGTVSGRQDFTCARCGQSFTFPR
jgi:transposase-like protein